MPSDGEGYEMALNKNVNPRPLTPKEKEDRKHGVYDSFDEIDFSKLPQFGQ